MIPYVFNGIDVWAQEGPWEHTVVVVVFQEICRCCCRIRSSIILLKNKTGILEVGHNIRSQDLIVVSQFCDTIPLAPMFRKKKGPTNRLNQISVQIIALKPPQELTSMTVLRSYRWVCCLQTLMRPST